MKVYIVYTGEHGEYDIQGVFSNKSKAERFIADNRDYESVLKFTSTYIDEFEVDKNFEWDNRVLYYEYVCEIYLGKVNIVRISPSFECNDHTYGKYFYHYSIYDTLNNGDLNKIFIEWVVNSAEKKKED
jgi:hypothetical protein